MTQAEQWYRKAAEQDDAIGQSGLGSMYLEGEGVPKDFVVAYMWFNLAAAHGDDGAKRYRDIVEAQMTPDQIAEAQRPSREWKPTR